MRARDDWPGGVGEGDVLPTVVGSGQVVPLRGPGQGQVEASAAPVVGPVHLRHQALPPNSGEDGHHEVIPVVCLKGRTAASRHLRKGTDSSTRTLWLYCTCC